MNCKNKSIMTKKKAFTLVELLIVIAIIGILFIVLVSKVDFATDKAKASGVQTDFRSFQLAFDTVAKENAGFNTFGWDTGDANQNGKRDSYDEGDTNKNGIQNTGEVWTGHKVYDETFTKVYSLKKNGTGSYDRDALNRLETAINANLDPKLHITIKDDGEIVMANGAKDPWNKEYHGWYISNAETDGLDRGAIVMYSDGANNEFGSEHSIANGVVTITVPGSNKAGKDDYSIASCYTYVNGYGEVLNVTTGFSNNQTMLGGNGGTVNNADDDLSLYTLYYYSSLNEALADAHSGDLGANQNATSSDAKVALYNRNGSLVVRMMNDVEISESIIINSDIEIKLCGKTLTSSNATAMVINSGNVTLDATNGGQIVVNGTNTISAIEQNGGSLLINGGTYTVNGANKGVAIKVASGTALINDASINIEGTGSTYGVAIQNGCSVVLNDCQVSATGTGNTTYGVYSAGQVEVNNGSIVALSDGKTRGMSVTATGVGVVTRVNIKGTCVEYGATSTASSQGISCQGTMTVVDCTVWGSHSGISNSGNLTVKGGSYSSPGHGGIYFGNISTPAYIYDAKLFHADAPANSTAAADYNDCGFYLGGGSDRNNIVVYMDNCDITGDSWYFTLRSSNGEHDNTLYISNSRVYGNGYIRSDDASHKIYVGVGNNFTADVAKDASGNDMSSSLIKTDDVYRYD